MSVSMYRGGGRAAGRPRSAPPDLPSLLLDARICYLGMPVRQIYLNLSDILIYYSKLPWSYFIFVSDCASSDWASCRSIYVVGLW